MAYIPLALVAPGDPGTSAWANTVKGNFDASAVAIAAVKGDIFVATAANVLARLPVGADASSLIADSGEASGLRWQIQPSVHVTNSGALLMVQEVWTSIAFDTETADTDGMHAAAPNPSYLTVPVGGDGWYTFGFNGNASRAAVSDVSFMVRILLNGATVIAQTKAVSGRPAYINLSMGYPLVAGNYLEAQYYSGPVADQSLAIGASFWAVWQRP